MPDRRPPPDEPTARALTDMDLDRPVTTSDTLRELLEDPNATRRIHSWAVTQFHSSVCSLGIADSMELLAMAKPEQVRGLLDLEVWSGDRLDVDEALDWLYVLASLPEEVRGKHLGLLDVELIGLVLKRQLQIHLADQEEMPEDPAGMVYVTPDGWFNLEILAEDEMSAERLVELINTLYEHDHERIRRLLQNLMWELPTELEEYAYRWRSGRLQDLGFADPQEAWAIYTYLDPSSVTPDEKTSDRAPRADSEPIGEVSDLLVLGQSQESFWERSIAQIDGPEERERLGRALLLLGNRCLSADRISPANLAAAKTSLEKMRCRLSLGLEFLCGGELERAPAVLGGVALLRIARVGFSLTIDLRRRILPLARAGKFGRTSNAFDLLDPPLRQQIAELAKPRPELYDESRGQSRALATLDDLENARRCIAAAVTSLALMEHLVVEPDLADHGTWGDRFRTMVVNGLLHRRGPLDRRSLAEFLERFVDCGRLTPDVLQAARAVLPPNEPLQTAVVDQWIAALEQSIAPLNPGDLDLRFIAGLVLESP